MEKELREEWFFIKQLLSKYKGMKMANFCQYISHCTEGGDTTPFMYPVQSYQTILFHLIYLQMHLQGSR